MKVQKSMELNIETTGKYSNTTVTLASGSSIQPSDSFFHHHCKVEFIQPPNWLYSVPNLLVIQHLVTLYLGGFDVRVVSEIE